MKRRFLQVWALTKASYSSVFHTGFGNRILYWFLLLWISSEIFGFVTASQGMGDNAKIIFSTLIFGPLYSFFIVRWHRFVWAQEEFGTLKSMLPTKRDWEFFGVYISIMIIMTVFVMIATLFILILNEFSKIMGEDDIVKLIILIAQAFLFIISFIIYFWISARVALAFPIIALDSTLPVFLSWSLSKSHAWKIFACITVCSGPFLFCAVIASMISEELIKEQYFIAALLADGTSMFSQLVGFSTGAAALTHIFRVITCTAPISLNEDFPVQEAG